MDRVKEARCPRCSALFTPDQVHAADPTARCTFCGTELLIKVPPPPAPPPAPPEMPASLEVVELPPRPTAPPGGGDPYRSAPPPAPRGALEIRWRDRRFVWWAVLIGLFFVAHLVTGALFAGAHPWTFGALALVLGIAYLTAAILVNRTTLRVDDRVIVWSRGPLPVWPGRRIGVTDIAQVFTVRETAKQRTTGFTSQGGFSGDSVHYAVKMKTRLGREHEIADLPSADQARWLEYAIERHLGIEDRPVEGELPRPPGAASLES